MSSTNPSDRRQFLKRSSALMLASAGCLAERASADEGGPEVRVAVVGTGARGSDLIRKLTTIQRARIVAGAVRTAHMLSIGMPGIIDETRLSVAQGKLSLILPPAYGALDGERLRRRLAALARLIELESDVIVTD